MSTRVEVFKNSQNTVGQNKKITYAMMQSVASIDTAAFIFWKLTLLYFAVSAFLLQIDGVESLKIKYF